MNANTNPSRTILPTSALIFLFAASIYLLTGRGMVGSIDALMMLKTTESIVERGSTELDPTEYHGGWVSRTPDGRVYSIYGIGKPLANVPAYVLGRSVSGFLPGTRKDAGIHFFVSQVNPLVSAAAVAALFLMCVALGFTEGESVFLALLYGFASIALPYAKDDMSEPLATFLVTAGLTAAIRLQRSASNASAIVAALTLGGAVATRYLMAIVPLIVGLLLVVSAVRNGRPRLGPLLWFFGVLGAIACLLAWFNYVRFGSPTETGYESTGGGASGFTFLSPQIPSRWLAFLISPGRGILVYMPFLVIVPLGFSALWNQRRFASVVLLACFAANFILSAAYKFWDAPWGWGPRYLLSFLPLLFPFFGMGFRAISGKGMIRPIILGLCLVGFLINGAATIAPWERYMTRVSQRETEGAVVDVNWSIADCQIVNQPRVLWDVLTLPAAERKQLSNGHKDPASALRSSRSLNLLSLWPVRLVSEGIPLLPVLAASVLLLLVAALSGSIIWFRLSASSNIPAGR
ncbi:MAG: ArnT family glycosyltransferase [Verrucomicrobiota bacterium]